MTMSKWQSLYRWKTAALFSSHFILPIIILSMSQQISTARIPKSGRNFQLMQTKFYDDHYRKESKKSDKEHFEKEMQLYSLASGAHVQIMENSVDGKGKHGSRYARLITESDNFGRILIRGAVTKNYLCMNKRGRLIVRKNGRGRKRCIFKESSYNGFTEFINVGKDGWHIAISKRGSPRSGSKTRSGMKSVHFIERVIDTKSTRSRYLRKLSRQKQNIKSTIRELEDLRRRLAAVMSGDASASASPMSLSERTVLKDKAVSLADIIAAIDKSLSQLRSKRKQKGRIPITTT